VESLAVVDLPLVAVERCGKHGAFAVSAKIAVEFAVLLGFVFFAGFAKFVSVRVIVGTG